MQFSNFFILTKRKMKDDKQRSGKLICNGLFRVYELFRQFLV
jgi:hypothetical protein